MTMKSMPGKSNPVVKTLLLTTARYLPSLKSSSKRSRSAFGNSPDTTAQVTPMRLSISDMWEACSRPAAKINQCLRSAPACIASFKAAEVMGERSTASWSCFCTNSPPCFSTSVTSNSTSVLREIRGQRYPSAMRRLKVRRSVRSKQMSVKIPPSVSIPIPSLYGVAVRPMTLIWGLTALSASMKRRYWVFWLAPTR